MTTSAWRVANLPFAAKITLTAFLALVGVGYLVGVRNIYEHHHDADLEAGALTMDDLRRVYHGLDKEVTADEAARPRSVMEKMVSPGGPMRKFLEKGGEPAVRALTTWLQRGSKVEEFTQAGLAQPGDPSAQRVIGMQCVGCHNAADGEKADVPYALSVLDHPQYDLVAALATPPALDLSPQTRTQHLAPTGRAHLVQVTHAHIMAIPVFTLLVACLFFLTGLPAGLKAVAGPIPMLVLCADFASWWLARVAEPFVFVIAGAGAVFGLFYGLQIVCVFFSMWFGRR